MFSNDDSIDIKLVQPSVELCGLKDLVGEVIVDGNVTSGDFFTNIANSVFVRDRLKDHYLERFNKPLLTGGNETDEVSAEIAEVLFAKAGTLVFFHDAFISYDHSSETVVCMRDFIKNIFLNCLANSIICLSLPFINVFTGDRLCH